MKTLVFRKKHDHREEILFISNQIRRHTLVAGRLVQVEDGLRPISIAVMLSRERKDWTLEGHSLDEHEVSRRWPDRLSE